MIDFKLFEQPLGHIFDPAGNPGSNDPGSNSGSIDRTVIVLDNGGGWYTAASAQLHLQDGSVTVENPRLLKLRGTGGDQDKYLESNLTFKCGTPLLTGKAQAYPLYTNFKDIPSTLNLHTQVQPGDPLTRGEAMKASIQAMIAAICANNADVAQRLQQGNVILYAGHPSSERWTDRAVVRNYCKLVEEAVSDAGFSARCMTFSESRAAVFYARRKDPSISDTTTVMIIDVGASTVDITFICPTAFVQQDVSETLGGRDLDAALLARALGKMNLTPDDLAPNNESMLLFQLRAIKEKFYPAGQMRTDQEHKILLPLNPDRFVGNADSVSVTITAEDMDVAFDNGTDAAFGARLRAFLASFLGELGESARTIDRVILTGGTANVSQAREVIAEVLAGCVSDFDAEKQIIPLIGTDDTLSAVALGGIDLMASNLRVSAAFDKLEKNLTQRLVTDSCLSADFKTRLAMALKAENDFLDMLYKNAYKPWAEAKDNLSLEKLDKNCKDDLTKHKANYSGRMCACLNAALKGEMKDAKGFFSMFNGFFDSLGIRFDSEKNSPLPTLRGKVEDSLSSAIQPLTDQLTDCVSDCNTSLNTNLAVIHDFATFLTRVAGGIINKFLNVLRGDTAVTQPRLQATRKGYCDYANNGQAVKTYIACSLFSPRVDEILKTHLKGCDEGKTQSRGEALRDEILERIIPCLRNAIFMANDSATKEESKT